MNNYNIFEVLEYRSIYNKGIRLQSVSRAFSLLLIWIEIMTLTFEGHQNFLHFKDNDKASFFCDRNITQVYQNQYYSDYNYITQLQAVLLKISILSQFHY